MIHYVRDNKAAMCNCPRQCRHLAYKHGISQAMFADYGVESTMDFLRPVLRSGITTDEFRKNFCILQVTRHVSSLIMNTFTRHLQQSDAVVRLDMKSCVISVKNDDLIYSTVALVLPISIAVSGVVQRVDNSTGAFRRDQTSTV